MWFYYLKCLFIYNRNCEPTYESSILYDQILHYDNKLSFIAILLIFFLPLIKLINICFTILFKLDIHQKLNLRFFIHLREIMLHEHEQTDTYGVWVNFMGATQTAQDIPVGNQTCLYSPPFFFFFFFFLLSAPPLLPKPNVRGKGEQLK